MSTAFDLLAPPVQLCLWRMGWTELRQIQSDAILSVLNLDHDLIISAATASGKTEAAFLPIISRLTEAPADSIAALYVSPLKALINDQFRRLEELCEHAEIPVHRWHGDVSQSAKSKLVKNPSGILLTTPESLESLFINRSSALPRLFGSLQYVVIDELHAFVGRERGTHLRSLLHRLEQRIRHRFRILALSATLGEWVGNYATWIRPGQEDRVSLLTDHGDEKTVRLKVYGYTSGEGSSPDEARDDEAKDGAGYLVDDVRKAFDKRKGLIFANRKNDVELLADALNDQCRRQRKPESFLVHHGSLSKEIREQTEQMMRGSVAFTTLCSSTLELGIDIGDVEVVGQIGAPWSVSSLVQRLGRSGRRGNDASEMRIFIECLPLHNGSSLVDRLRPELLQAIALTELMLEKWREPPESSRCDLSTLVQQILSILAETGGTTASFLLSELIQNGAFRETAKQQFVQLLRALGEQNLIEQMPQGDLILGVEGERIVKSMDFYSAFASSKEFTVMSAGEAIGSIAAIDPPPPLDHLLLAGRRWQVVDVDTRREEINVIPASGKKAAPFQGSGGEIHDRVRGRMRTVLLGQDNFKYLNSGAANWLTEARQAATRASLHLSSWHQISSARSLLFTWSGSRTQRTIVLFARAAGIEAVDRRIAIEFPAPERIVRHKLLALLHSGLSSEELADKEAFHARRKYDCYVPSNILRECFAADALDIDNCIAVVDRACHEA
ncbi:DEAD/DEAH box helicase [Lacipirellula sp.]|uniref:DEAD/DEAH box helicase n=1 Tax=Lacipirellula sp. TaxID=2691419 RepID=UPI003D12CA78